MTGTQGETGLIARYTRPGMGAIWTDENKYRMLAGGGDGCVARRWREDGIVPARPRQAIRDRGDFDLKRIQRDRGRSEARRDRLHHGGGGEDRAAESRWLHYGLTSNDVVDTAQALQVKAASAIIARGHRGAGGGAEAARARVQAHADDRPHARRACRADDLRAEAAELVRGDASAIWRASTPRRKTCASASSPARWAPSAI